MQTPALTPFYRRRGIAVTRAAHTFWRRRLASWLVEGWLHVQTALLYIFLYTPIAVVVLFSFNNSRRVSVWNGFTTQWYQAAWNSPDVTGALQISLTVALLNVAISVTLGTLASLGMRSAPRGLRVGFEGLVYMTIITPEIVIAIASLLYFVNLGIDLGIQTMVVTHAVYNTSIVALIVSARLAGMDRTLEEASADLGATPLDTFWRVTLPQLYPAVLAGALLALMGGCGGGVSDPASARCPAPPTTFGKRVVRSDHAEIAVHYRCEGASIAGTLYLPKGEGRHPVLVWVHGAGAETRLHWGPFLRPFIEAGLAVASFDKRGVGESGGKCCPGDTGHFNLLTADAVGSVSAVRRAPGVDPRRVGMFGASAAGWVVPRAAGVCSLMRMRKKARKSRFGLVSK